MESLSDKLKSLGVELGTAHLPAPVPKRTYGIETLVEGELVTTHVGEAFKRVERFDMEYRHGKVDLNRFDSPQTMLKWARCMESERAGDKSAYVFLDTETTGLSGGTGTLAFMVGIGFFNGQSEFQLEQYFLRDPVEEQALLYALSEQLGKFEFIVTYNGKAFDVPLLRTRFILQGIAHPFDGLQHLDLLPLSRRLWRNSIESRTLQNLEVQIIGAFRTQEEVPGWLIPQMYYDYLRSADARPMKGIFYHNAMDILSLAALFTHINHVFDDSEAQDALGGADAAALARLYEDMSEKDKSINLYANALSQELSPDLFFVSLERYAGLYRRAGQWEKAVELWQIGAGRSHLPSVIALAKYYEHRAIDLSLALDWVEKGLAMVEQSTLPLHKKRQLKLDLQKRYNRLIGKTDHRTVS
ncbi:MAG TPA: ribonuclease H-like domain-containing protein [Longilinea sp.]|nr:ribonuclease H-like domain-containing protein [Longilinea sp.]